MTQAKREIFRAIAKNIGWVIGPTRHNCYTYWGLSAVASALGVSCDTARELIREWIGEGMPTYPTELEQAAALRGEK